MQSPTFRERIGVVIFEHDTAAGRLFDVVLLWAVLLSILTVILESVESVRSEHGDTIRIVEWVFTALFSVEYALRTYSARRRLAYVTSFFGLIDIVAILPAFVVVLTPTLHSLVVVRVLRLLRVFRVLKWFSATASSRCPRGSCPPRWRAPRVRVPRRPAAARVRCALPGASLAVHLQRTEAPGSAVHAAGFSGWAPLVRRQGKLPRLEGCVATALATVRAEHVEFAGRPRPVRRERCAACLPARRAPAIAGPFFPDAWESMVSSPTHRGLAIDCYAGLPCHDRTE